MAYRTSRRLAGLCHSAGRLIPWILLSCGAATVQARVIRVVVDSRSPEVGPSPTSIAYERIRGVIYGEVDPRNPLNAVIQDVALAPRNGRGMVEYATTFTLIKPAAMSQASGLLLYEVVQSRRIHSSEGLIDRRHVPDEWMARRFTVSRQECVRNGRRDHSGANREKRRWQHDHRSGALAVRKYEARCVFRADAFGRRICILGRSSFAC